MAAKAPNAAPKEEKKKKKADVAAAPPVEAAPAPAPAPAPKPAPVDPRLKVLKKFQGKFLPKGVLRVRHKEIMDRWNSGEDHGGVNLEELKTLLADWRGTREKPPRLPKA